MLQVGGGRGTIETPISRLVGHALLFLGQQEFRPRA